MYFPVKVPGKLCIGKLFLTSLYLATELLFTEPLLKYHETLMSLPGHDLGDAAHTFSEGN